MSQVYLSYATFSCDATGCEESLTLGGEDADMEAVKAGWKLGAPFFEKLLDFCPACVKELEGFVNDAE